MSSAGHYHKVVAINNGREASTNGKGASSGVLVIANANHLAS
jgi:hypothetical protein